MFQLTGCSPLQVQSYLVIQTLEKWILLTKRKAMFRLTVCLPLQVQSYLVIQILEKWIPHLRPHW